MVMLYLMSNMTSLVTVAIPLYLYQVMLRVFPVYGLCRGMFLNTLFSDKPFATVEPLERRREYFTVPRDASGEAVFREFSAK